MEYNIKCRKSSRIIQPVERRKLVKELTSDKFYKFAGKSGYGIYIFDYHNSPNLMHEVARLREKTYRSMGRGCGDPLDIDIYDIQPIARKQMIVWDNVTREIICGLRFAFNDEISSLNQRTTSNYFFRKLMDFKKNFKAYSIPITIEIGKVFYQSKCKYSGDGKISNSLTEMIDDLLEALFEKFPAANYFCDTETSNCNEIVSDSILYYNNKHNSNRIVKKQTITKELLMTEINRMSYAKI